MSADRPINADVPAAPEPEPEVEETPKAPPKAEKPAAEPSRPAKETPKPAAETRRPEKPRPAPPAPRKRQRRPVPGALKLVVGLFLAAIVFAVAAILGGSGGSKKEATGAGPTPTRQSSGGSGGDSGAAAEASEELGYPAFATNNTTRVGGSTPAANAAAVALAVFPSTTPAQRPEAVTLVSEEDWAGAIAAAVLMAAPVRAPVLFSGASGEPEATSEALAALDPRGGPATDGAAAFAIGGVTVPEGLKATTVKAQPAAAEAASIAALRDHLFGGPPRHIVVASANRAPLAMPAAAWAARSGDPVLFTGPKKLPAATAAALRRHTKVPVYVLGPSSAISAAVVKEIGAISGRVRRVAGADPVAGAIALARYGDGSFGWNVNDPGHGFVLARADSPLEAAAAAPLSASGTWGPLLLTDSADTLPAELRSYFLDVKPGYTNNPTRAFYNHVWVVGDQEAIDVNQQAEVNELAELAEIGGGE